MAWIAARDLRPGDVTQEARDRWYAKPRTVDRVELSADGRRARVSWDDGYPATWFGAGSTLRVNRDA